MWRQCAGVIQFDSQQLLYLLQVSYGLPQILGLLIFLLPHHVLLLLVQETDDVGNFGVLVHVEGQVIKGGEGLTFAERKTRNKEQKNIWKFLLQNNTDLSRLSLLHSRNMLTGQPI